jgi:hypothetical protein
MKLKVVYELWQGSGGQDTITVPQAHCNRIVAIL